MKNQYLRSLLIFTVVTGTILGLIACGSSNSSTSSGGNSAGEGFGMHEMSGNAVMTPGEQIPTFQSVHVHESGSYPVVVQNPMIMTLECIGRVNYSYNQSGQVENGICENQSMSLPIIASGTMQLNFGQGADIGLELHV